MRHFRCGKNRFPILLLYAIPSLAVAQTATSLPQPPDLPLPAFENGNVKYISIDDIPSQGKDLFRYGSRVMNQDIDGHQVRVLPATAYGVAMLERFVNRITVEPDAEKKILVKLSPVEGEPAGNLKFLGFVPEGPTPQGPWTRVSRLYRTGNDGLVMLSEWDYQADHGAILTIREMQNAQVKNSPASLAVQKSEVGSVLWQLSWSTKSKSYILYMSSKEDNVLPRTLVDFANAISD